MRGEQDSTSKHADGWTKQELMEAVVGEGTARRGGLSPKTFDAIRKVARVKGPTHGGMSWVYSPEDVAALIHAADGGRFTERGAPIAAAWRQLLEERE